MTAALSVIGAAAAYAAAAAPIPTPATVSPHNYSFGSGTFGQWKQDRFGLPVYALDVTQDWTTLVGGGMLGNLHQVGNDRLIGMAHGTALSGSISTVLTGLSWICVGIHSRRALLCPVCA